MIVGREDKNHAVKNQAKSKKIYRWQDRKDPKHSEYEKLSE